MKKKLFSLLGAAFLISMSLSMTSFAGQWQEDSKGWWYQNDDGSYVSNDWQEIDGKRYRFDETGYMITNFLKPGVRSVLNRL